MNNFYDFSLMLYLMSLYQQIKAALLNIGLVPKQIINSQNVHSLIQSLILIYLNLSDIRHIQPACVFQMTV